jgi:alkylation response protein AidB-like acyl-CoA dehydrogenase
MIDGHGAAEVVIERLPVDAQAVLGEVDGAVPLVIRALDHGIAAVCGEALGSMAHLVTATAEHIRTRQQYGAPLAKFQALQHRMADMYIQTEGARSMAYLATLSLHNSELQRMRYLSAAKAQVSRFAKFVGYHAVQLHGGMGMSEELDIGHHYMRLVTISQLFGDSTFHLQRFAALDDLVDGEDAVTGEKVR